MSKSIRIIASMMLLLCLSIQAADAQTPGLIYKPAANGGNKILDPDGNGYVSKTTAGFLGQNMDEGELYSEIPYRPFPVFMNEPLSDLATGSKGGHTDYAPRIYDSSGKPIGSPLAMYFDGKNFLFRVRLGGQSTASKGYSILIDTNNDVSGTGRNPGFEFEVVLATNFDVRIYDHRINTTGGNIIFNGSVDQYSQKAIASSMGGGDPDYFYDFYVPMDAFGGGITSSTPLRMTGVTVTSAKSGIFGVASDVGGADDQKYGGNTTNAWRDIITSTPPSTPTGIKTGGFTAMPATAPVVSSPIFTTSSTITGYSVEASGSIIRVYQGATLLGSTTVGTNGTWSLGSFATALVANAKITATVTPTDKTVSPSSNEVAVKTTQSICKTEPPIITNNDGSKGFLITTAVAGTIRIYKYSAGAWVFDREFTGTTPGTSKSYQYGNGAKTLPNGTYYATLVPSGSGSCESERSNEVCFIAANGNNGDAISIINPPVVNNTTLLTSTTSLNGSVTDPGSIVSVYQNGMIVQSITLGANVTTWSYTLSNLTVGDIFYVKATKNSSSPCGTILTSGRSTVLTVQNNASSAQSVAPTITGTYCGTTNSISGTSTEKPGTIINLYNGTTLIKSGTVDAFGSWTVTGLSLAANTTVTAKALAPNKTESVSSASKTIGTVYTAGTLSISTSTIIQEGATTVSGTAPAGSFITLYINNEAYVDQNGGVVTVVTNSSGVWTIDNISPFELYAGAVLTIKARATAASVCESGPSVGVTVACTPADTSILTTLTEAKICPDKPAFIRLSKSENGVIYNIYKVNADNSEEQFGSSVLGTGYSITLTSKPISVSGTKLIVKTIKVGAPCQYVIGSPIIVELYPAVPRNFTVLATPESANCPNTSVSLVLKNLEAGYSYQLINNVTQEKIGTAIVPAANQAGQDLVFPSVTVTQTTTFGIVITGVNSGCTAENTILKTITISSPADVNRSVAVNQSIICVGTSATITVNTQSGYTYKVYEQSNPSVLLATITGDGSNVSRSISAPFTSTGTKTLFVTVTGGGCTDLVLTNRATIEVTDGTGGTITAGADKTVCGNTFTLEGSQPTPGTGVWSIEAKPFGAPDPIFANSTQYNSIVSGLVSGKYEFTWHVTSACTGQEVSKSVKIEVNCPAAYSVKTTKFVNEYVNGDELVSMSDEDGGIVSAVLLSGTLPPGTTLNQVTGQLLVTDQSKLVAGNYTYRTTTTDANGIKTNSDVIVVRMYSTDAVPPLLPFPVELISFSAQVASGEVFLHWATASEKNNERFDIERSADGKTFERIGTVQGNGTTNQKRVYTFLDKHPMQGTAYYRLKQVDFDGKYTYSKLVEASLSSVTNKLYAYPNPFTNQLTMVISTAAAEKASVVVLDVQGREVMRKEAVLQKGINEVDLTLPTTLSKGLYFISVMGTKTNTTVKALKH